MFVENGEEFDFLNVNTLPVVGGKIRITGRKENYPDKIYKIGKGNNTGDNKVLEFEMPLSYAGEWVFDGEEYVLFKFPDEGIKHENLFWQGWSFYLMMTKFTDEKGRERFFGYFPSWHKTHTIFAVFNNREEVKT